MPCCASYSVVGCCGMSNVVCFVPWVSRCRVACNALLTAVCCVLSPEYRVAVLCADCVLCFASCCALSAVCYCALALSLCPPARRCPLGRRSHRWAQRRAPGGHRGWHRCGGRSAGSRPENQGTGSPQGTSDWCSSNLHSDTHYRREREIEKRR